MTLVQTPRSPLSDLEPHLITIANKDLWRLSKKRSPKKGPELDYEAINECLASVEKLALIVGEMEDEISDEERKTLAELAIKLFKLVERIDLCIENVESLSESVPGKQKAYDKLVHFANRTEDVAEVCELAVDEEFNNMIKDRLQSYFNARSEN